MGCQEGDGVSILEVFKKRLDVAPSDMVDIVVLSHRLDSMIS